MREDFLHYIWRHSLLGTTSLKTTASEPLRIIKPGQFNVHAGPDFLQAELLIHDQKWVGDVEIHIKSSDWYAHHHEHDVRYDAVLLHVVWEYDVEVFMKNNLPIPTLVLQDYIDATLLANYKKLFSSSTSWILCEDAIQQVSPFTLKHWFERLYFERLENKASHIKNLLSRVADDWDAVFFQLMAERFGGVVNKQAFLTLSQSFPYNIVRKERFYTSHLEALFLGQAGFLETATQGVYIQKLQGIYRYLQSKYQLVPGDVSQFQFFRMRPAGFPTLRLVQLASLFSTHDHLFSKTLTISSLPNYYPLFTVVISDFWKQHYTFEKRGKHRTKNISISFIQSLLINAILPLQFLYQQSYHSISLEHLLTIIKQIPAEQNQIIRSYKDLGIIASNAMESQALLELKNNYCTPKRCLSCAIGNALVLKNT